MSLSSGYVAEGAKLIHRPREDILHPFGSRVA